MLFRIPWGEIKFNFLLKTLKRAGIFRPLSVRKDFYLLKIFFKCARKNLSFSSVKLYKKLN